MDRREFLTSTGTAAGGLAVADAVVATPSIARADRDIVIAVPERVESMEPGAIAARIGARLASATDGRFRAIVVRTGATACETLSATAADLVLGIESDHSRQHPALSIFAGVPFGEHLDANAFLAWLDVGGGTALWRDIAAAHGIVSFVVGHTGASAGLWSNRIVESPASFAGARMAVSGLAADVVRRLGAIPVDMSTAAMKGALARGEIAAAEPAFPPIVPLADRSCVPGLMPGGTALAISMRTGFWSRLSNSDRAVFEGVFAESARLSVGEALAGAAMASVVAAASRRPLRTAFDPGSLRAICDASADVLSAIAAADPPARRIVDSHRAFRRLLAGADATAVA